MVISISSVAVSILVGVLSLLWMKRRQTKRCLESCGLPTVHWRPKFVNYMPSEESKKLASSTITNILPRMERLGGPFGMYGTVYGIWTSVVHVAHPVPAKAILCATATSNGTSTNKRRSSIAFSNGASKSPAYDHFKNLFGEGVFTANGEDWKAKRASVMHCLIKGTNSSTSDISQRLEREANRAADTFIAQVERLKETKKQAVVTHNVVPLLQRATVGLIYRFITHDEPEWGVVEKKLRDDPSVEASSVSVSSDEELSVSSQDHAVEDRPSASTSKAALLLVDSYLESIIRIRMIILAQSRSIWFLLPRWLYRNLSGMYQDEENTVGPIRKFAQQACDNAKPGSPLYQLQQMDSHNTASMVNGISKDVLDEAITLLFAGQDTSAATLSWTLHLLSLYPTVQSKLAKEVQRMLMEEGDLDKEDAPTVTKKMISKLPFLDAVVKESMRLYPVAPFVVRQLTHDLPVAVEDNEQHTTVLPAGALACIWIYGLHRNPKFWNRPNAFFPERWIDPDLKDTGQSNGAYVPFASGPRNCVGQPLAHVVLRTLLTRLIHKFDFRDERLESGLEASALLKDMQAGFTVLPSGGVMLEIRDR
jgi:cytochrome P450